MPAKLFVGNLSFQATEEDLRELFQQSGTVESVRIVTDQFTGRPRGFGFVEMSTKEEATKAIEMLNGRLFRDRNLVVDEARPQAQRGGGGGGGGGGGPRGDRGPRPGGTGGAGGGGWRR
jgi:cold-inducible RNA-binding protein